MAERRETDERGGGAGSLTAFDVKLHIKSVQFFAAGSDARILLGSESVHCTICIIF